MEEDFQSIEKVKIQLEIRIHKMTVMISSTLSTLLPTYILKDEGKGTVVIVITLWKKLIISYK